MCNGRACGATMPGPGAKGTGTVAAANYAAWQKICVNMDTICDNKPVDTRFDFFGQTCELPVLAAPVGAVKLHYGDKFTDEEYNRILVPACVEAGIAAFTGDGTDPEVFRAAAAAIGAAGGRGVPTVKPWDRQTLFAKLDEAKAAGAKVFAMDIDCLLYTSWFRADQLRCGALPEGVFAPVSQPAAPQKRRRADRARPEYLLRLHLQDSGQHEQGPPGPHRLHAHLLEMCIRDR